MDFILKFMAKMEPRRHHHHQQEEDNLMQKNVQTKVSPTTTTSSSSSRKLRSTTVKPKVNNAALFDFDNVNEYLHKRKPILIASTTTSSQSPYKHFGYTSSQLPNLPVRSPVLEIERVLPRRPPKNDPLPDSNYEIFHRKMRRNEKQMTNEEKIKNLWELDTLQSHLEDLNQLHWFKALPNITSIKDVKDYQEMERKRDLTITEIERLLRKHDLWRRRQDIFNTDVKSHVDYGDDESDPEYEIPIQQLRQHREWERRQRIGPIVRLNLNDKYCLVIDPLAPPEIVDRNSQDSSMRNPRSQIYKEEPEIVKETTNQHDAQVKEEEKEEERKEEEITSDFEDSEGFDEPIEERKQKRPRITSKVRLEDLEDVSEIDFKTVGTMLFGGEFDDLPTFRNGYQLPVSLKNWLNRS